MAMSPHAPGVTFVLAALAASGLPAGAADRGGFRPVETKVLRGGDEAVRVTADVAGVDELWLVATVGGDDYNYDQAIWADPVLLAADGTRTDLSSLKPAAAEVGWGHLITDRGQGNSPLKVAGRTYAKGFWAHAPSRLCFGLDGKYARFESFAGIDAGAGRNGSVTFQVLDRYEDPNERRRIRALRMAIEDLEATFPERYPKGYLARLDEVLAKEDPAARRDALDALAREAMLANPLLDFDRVVLIRRDLGDSARGAMGGALALPTNFDTNNTIRRDGWRNEIAVLSDLRGEGRLGTVFRPEGGAPVTDLDLHFDGERIMFSSVGGPQRQWRLFEVRADGTGLRQLSPDDGSDVGHFDSCYLPDGRIAFDSTATMLGLPCVNGSSIMACLYLLDPETKVVRQLCFEQDSNWCPTVLNNGRILYQRWEYADLPHSNSRLLMHMNPDGTDQREFWGSGSYFPPSFFYARPIPGHSTRAVGIATGHHGTSRSGRLLIVDPALGRREAEGVVQEIPRRGEKVEPVVMDRLVDWTWPQFIHPYPLAEPGTDRGAGKYFLVSMKRDPAALWGVYLVDTFDNMTLLKEVDGAALMEPIPLRPTRVPPAIPDRVDLSSRTATVYVHDVHRGPGLAGVPRGEVKRLRVGSYYFSPRGTGGLLGTIGMDGPWDVKRILGTVPVEPDGSAFFTVPANTPLFLQPLDAEGKALQLMRSWFVGMPGENLACIGCHESQSDAPTRSRAAAARRRPDAIEPWQGPARGFSFAREVQPILDRRCVRCHDGSAREDGKRPPDLRGDRVITDWSSAISGCAGGPYGGRFSASYAELHRYVRRPGIESDLRMHEPLEFHADTTELVQMLAKGHRGVELDPGEWERLVCWIDMNAPFHGDRASIPGYGHVRKLSERASELSRRYAGITWDYDDLPAAPAPMPPAEPERPSADEVGASRVDPEPRVAGPWTPRSRSLDLGNGERIELAWVPAGEFAMGSAGGPRDERPVSRVRIERGFWMGKFEVTNAQFRAFDPRHDSRHESRHGYQFGRLGYDVNGPDLPAVRLSWQGAARFCEWLSGRAGARVVLPTEAQWEWACRAGERTPFSFGAIGADYSAHANLGDRRLREFAACTAQGGYTAAAPLANPNRYDDWVPRDDRFDDGAFLSAKVGSYRSNAWGLHDMHGNVAEWTRSLYRPYPCMADDGRDDPAPAGRRVVRGGSWYDRPARATASFRLAYRDYQGVFNVGFRVVVEE